ncbi:hypothetical protein [Sporolactobacillus sp. KGMB 08714]|uniref:hypothetical protein n=1 Tax=Sporolactobacillus sp. KGMB 08714 TaxID=3064704 RepID=UPI002FBEC2E7
MKHTVNQIEIGSNKSKQIVLGYTRAGQSTLQPSEVIGKDAQAIYDILSSGTFLCSNAGMSKEQHTHFIKIAANPSEKH